MPGKVVSRTEWIEARKSLLEKEKAATRAKDAFNAQLRNDFPMVKVDTDYKFTGPEGEVTLKDLFDGRKQLMVYHFMLGPDDEAGCVGCSFIADNLPTTFKHLNEKDTTLVMISRAPLPKITAYQTRMSWSHLPWYSSFNSPFNYDFHITLDSSVAPPQFNYKPTPPEEKGERPGLSVFYKGDDGEVYHTYSTYARGAEGLLSTYTLLDMTPLGRQEGKGMDVKRKDEY